MTRLRVRAALAAALVLAVVVSSTAVAARLWLLSATPLTLTAGVATAVTLSATNIGGSSGGDEITCIRIQLPSGFTVAAVSIVSVRGDTSGPARQAWQVVWPGGNVVTVKDPGDDYPLVGSSPPDDELIFRITGTAASAGVMTWTGDAADKPGGATSTSCGSGDFPVATLAFTVVPSLLPTPTPTPTTPPTSTPSPDPTGSPTPAPTSAPSTARPPGPTPTPSATSSAAVRPSGSPTPSPAGDDPGATEPAGTDAADPVDSAVPPSSDDPERGVGSTGTTPPNGSAPAAGGDELAITIGDQGADGGSDDEGAPIRGVDRVLASVLQELPGGPVAWSYPALVLTVPGLLLILAVLAQTAGALAWIPIVRRALGGFGLRRRRRRNATPQA